MSRQPTVCFHRFICPSVFCPLIVCSPVSFSHLFCLSVCLHVGLTVCLIVGTYEGQWLRGVRHGYGVRQSVSYDLALRYHQSNAFPFPPAPSPNGPPLTLHGQDPLLSARDRRTEQGRAGGFVLVADLREKDVGKRGRTGLRGTLRLIRQRSTGDIEEPSRVGVHATGGSVRSMVSTGRGKGRSPSRGGSRDEEDEEEWGSFVSLVGESKFQEDVVEKYWGEWKNDRRSGYGICERSDGIKYEGQRRILLFSLH